MEDIQKIYEIVFVDDGSTDHSFKALVELKHRNTNIIKIIKLRRNFGQTSALDAGFRHSARNILISMDADLQNDPEDISDLIQKLDEGYDVVCGWRHQRRDVFSNRLILSGACLLRKWILNDRIHDSGCTLQAYKSGTGFEVVEPGKADFRLAFTCWNCQLAGKQRLFHTVERKETPLLYVFKSTVQDQK